MAAELDVRATLKTFEIFDDLPDALLEWLTREGTVRRMTKGERLFDSGVSADEMFVVLEGTIHIERHIGAQFIGTLTMHAGTISGLLPYSRMRIYQGRGYALEPTVLLLVHRTRFAEMLVLSEEFGARLVGLMSDRVRDTARHDQQREKLAALGTWAAGISHELNNPASAARRAAVLLGERLAALPEVTARLVRHPLAEAQVADAVGCALRDPADTAGMTALQRSRRESAVSDWLDARGVHEAWMLADTFSEAGLEVSDLDGMAEGLPDGALSDVLAWVDALIASRRLARDIADATARISEMVGAVKAYTHLDRAQDKQLTDLRAGLQSTLVMLGHKVRQRKAEVTLTFADDFPEVPVLPGEINQVWTNLIDNALDAIAEGGHIRIESVREGDVACIRVADDGSGIPEATQSRIFEPFFTTKPVGSGTGLGLDIVHRIVVQHHAGDIGVRSKPGETVFTVCLPLD